VDSKKSWAELVDDFSEDEVDFPRCEQQGRQNSKEKIFMDKVETEDPHDSESSRLNSTCHSTCGSTEELLERNSSLHDSGTETPREYEPPASPTKPSAISLPVCKIASDSGSPQPSLHCVGQVECVSMGFMSPVTVWPSASGKNPSFFGDTACWSPHAEWPMDSQLTQSGPSNMALASHATQGVNQSGNFVNYGFRGFSQPPAVWLGTVTVMMRNLPNKYSQVMLREEINDAGFSGFFDFMHLPIDNESKLNKGYAFINFMDSACSWSFKCHYEGRRMSRFNSDKCVSVVPASIQGFLPYHAVKREPLVLNDSAASGTPSSRRRRRPDRNRRSLIDESFEAQQNKKAEAERFESSEKVLEEKLPEERVQEIAALQEKEQETIVETSKDDQPKKDRQTESISLQRKFCPYCGSSTKPEVLFCNSCGSDLPQF